MDKLRSIKIPYDTRAILIERINRFLARVELLGKQRESSEVLVHIRDPGRLEDLLFPRNELLLQHKRRKNRKTEWEAIFAKNNSSWVLINSGFHRAIAEWAFEKLELFNSPISNTLAEQRIGKSRIDFLAELEDNSIVAIETKGCTLAVNQKALFPDAPTKRGARHVSELIQFMTNGSKAAILFLIFRAEARCFYANKEIDQEFADIFEQAYKRGVQIIPLQFYYDAKEEWLYYKGKLPLCKK